MFFAGLADGDLWKITPQLFSIFLTLIVVCGICITYNVKIRNHQEGEKKSGFLVMIDWIISGIEEIVVSIMGKRYRKLTPYALYIVFYIVVGSTLSLLGFESPSTSYTVTLSMGLITFVMIYYFGFKFQKLAYFKRYINPLELFTQFTPLLSISFRLFGNLLGGSIILSIVYSVSLGMQNSWASNPSETIAWWAGLNIFSTALTPFLHMYFDLFDGGVQSIVFMMLTFSYWAGAMGEDYEEEFETKEIDFKKQNKEKTIELIRQ